MQQRNAPDIPHSSRCLGAERATNAAGAKENSIAAGAFSVTHSLEVFANKKRHDWCCAIKYNQMCRFSKC